MTMLFNYFSRTTLTIFVVTVFISSHPVIAMDEGGMPPAQVTVVKAEERLIAPVISLSGTVISLNDANISAQVPGELLWVATVGTKVAEGDVIAEIEPTLLSINLQSAEAQLEKITAELNFRKEEFNRFKTLAQQDNTSKTRLEEESSKLGMLLQDLRSAEANVSMAKYYLSKAKISAPFSGHVTARLVSKGEFLSEGDEVIRLVDTFNREVSVNAPMDLLAFLKPQLLVQVSNSASSMILPITTIVPVGDEVSRMVEVRLAITDEQFIIGMPVKVDLPSADAITRVAVPRDSLIIKGNEVYIYRIGKTMEAEKIDANIDAIDGSWVAIKAIIETGDSIVIRGGERLMSGQAVSILEK